jgi:uncharacterized CHY-type Zn-finger protein
MTRTIHGEKVVGTNVDAETRCAHYHSPLDIIAIKFKCCGDWFPCFECHRENTVHPPEVWRIGERDVPAVLCGACGHQLTVNGYFNCDSACPECRSAFNPGCKGHYHLYFEVSR